MINIVLFGPPGSGKGTQAITLAEKFGLKHISTGDLFRYNLKNETELGQIAKSYMDKGNLVPDEVTSNMLADEVNRNQNIKGFIFDGYPRTTNQAEFLNKFLEEKSAEILVTLSLEVSDDILLERLLERGKTSGRADDIDANIIKNRIEEYYQKTTPVADFYKNEDKWISIEGVGSISDIHNQLVDKINNLL